MNTMLLPFVKLILDETWTIFFFLMKKLEVPMTNLYSLFLRSVLLPAVSYATKSNFWRLYQNFHACTRKKLYAPPVSDTLAQLQNLIAHAYQYVPFYHEQMKTREMHPDDFQNFEDFRKFPPTTKRDLTMNFPDRITSARKEFEPWRYASTSGTIERLTVIQDFRKRDFVRAAQLLALNAASGYQAGMKYMEIPPDICTNVCGASGTIDPPVWRYFLDNLKEKTLSQTETQSDLRGLIEKQILYRKIQLPSFSSEGLTQKPEALTEYIRAVNDYRPHTVKALPIYLYLLALHISENHIAPPRITGGLMPMGSSLTPHMKRVVESAFECRVHEDYGCAELGSIAAECRFQNGLHPFAGLFHVEVLRQERPVKPGEAGRLLITDLFNYAMPLIRYDIGDVAVIRQGPCTCGVPGDRIEIQGRIQDCIIGRDGVVFTPDQMIDLILGYAGVRFFQLEVRGSTQMHLQVVPQSSSKPDLKEICRLIANQVGGDPRITARYVPTILPEPGGKYRFVKNLTNAAEAVL